MIARKPMAFKAPRKKRCKSCREPFFAHSSLQVVCSIPCGIEHARKQETRKLRAEKIAGRIRLRTRSDYLKLAQVAFNRWVKLRDADLPCVSCGRYHAGQYHAGHYLSVGARPELRFEPSNVHKQCQPCNTHLSGNLVMYRHGLIKRIGVEAVEALESDHAPRKYTIEELKEMAAHYRKLARELEAARMENAA